VQGSTLGILFNFCAKNPPHLLAKTVNGHCRATAELTNIEAKYLEKQHSDRIKKDKNYGHKI